MKYLAILRDSVREAIDTKVFYVMIGLSGLVLLVVASIAYRPLTVEEEVSSFTDQLSWMTHLVAKGQAPHWSVVDFQQTNRPAPLWEGDYRFTLRLDFPNAETAAEASKASELRDTIQSGLRQKLPYLKDLQVAAATLTNPTTVSLEVTSHGTTVTSPTAWPHEPSIFFVVPVVFWHQSLGSEIQTIEDIFVGTIGASIALLVSAVITAFFIPNMLRKGTIDLLLAKPIHRTTLLIYKFIGGLTFMFLNTVFVVAGIWLIVGLRTGLWGSGFLLTIPILTFQFAVFYAVSAVFAVLTRSPIVSILMSCLAWVLLFVVGWGYRIVDATRVISSPEFAQELGADAESMPQKKPFPNWVYTTADTVHFLLPRIKDLDVLISRAIMQDLLPADNPERKQADKMYASFRWSENLIVSSLYIVGLLGLACWRFAVKDY